MEPLFPPSDKRWIIEQSQIIVRSYARWFGRSLVTAQSEKEQALELFHLASVIASTDTHEDPVLNYGNQTALTLWELPWEKFTQTPGRHTAEPMEREARARFLEEVRENGFVENYQGVRISGSGRRFKIQSAAVWNLMDDKARFCGQAVMFKEWAYI